MNGKEINPNIFISKTLKHIDANTCFKKEKIKRLISYFKQQDMEYNNVGYKRKFKKSKNKSIKTYNGTNKKQKQIIQNEKNVQNEKLNLRQMNRLSSKYQLDFLSKISPYFQIENDSLSIEKNPGKNTYSKGFEYVWNQPSLLKLESEKQEQNFENEDDSEQNNIFSVNYQNMGNKNNIEYIQLKERYQRILEQNKKVKKRQNLFQKVKSRCNIRRIYHINYGSIDKHKPKIMMNNKSKRVFFPGLFVKENDIFKTLSPSKTRNKFCNKPLFSLCSSTSLKDIFSSNEDYKNRKKTNFINTNYSVQKFPKRSFAGLIKSNTLSHF